MRKSFTSAAIAGLLVTTTLLTQVPRIRADENATTQQAIFDRLMHAIVAKDRNEFLTSATDEMKRAITPALMVQMNYEIARHLDKGYDAKYLCELNQQGYDVHLWKVSFKDGSDDMIIRIVLRGEQLAGFFRQ